VQSALELLGGLNLVEFCSRDFGFDVTNDMMRAVPDTEIGAAGFGGLGQDGDLHRASLRLSEGFQ